ncbi:hypothetical protein AMTRI_Chr10g1720 [Amborella trichopoda]|uniref:DUF4378 domain-containing protein n=1 Tax=Amborella trichopoda TaxID=13333 RepID=W1PIK9_AMBTC|nr:protein LONGIFOLIA 1 [Amborella trichopoda]ERN07559.1 hypothetical protein AMTR_s00154p00080410 [Amborella trichopoda]|eukprot:XP_006845884.1 protein LONGIFOLIA 1 [Amborella trichopoda]
MSAKLLHALSEEHAELQKQIGCMTGIFQLFDRHHLITGKRVNGFHPKSLPSDRSLSNTTIHGAKDNGCPPQVTMGKNQIQNQSQRSSVEAPRTSLSSSSCSSSFSSLDNRSLPQSEIPSLEHYSFSDKSQKNLQKSHKQASSNKQSLLNSRNETSNSSAQMGRPSLDFRDLVKDSIYRETKGLSVKTKTKEETIQRPLKPQDSPRPPLQLPKPLDEPTGFNAKGRASSVDLNESLRVLAKLKEAPWCFNEPRDPPRTSYESKDGSLFSLSKDGSVFSLPKDAPRFSYDGREAPRPSSKIRELPRLSLDSGDSSSRSSSFDLKLGTITKELQRSSFEPKRNSISSIKTSSVLKDLQKSVTDQKSSGREAMKPQLEPEFKRQPPSVVARLMGLEAMPNSGNFQAQDQFVPTKTLIHEADNFPGSQKTGSGFSGTSKTLEETRPDRHSSSPRSSLRDPTSPRAKNSNPIMKPIANSRIPVEAAPWRQQNNSRSPRKMPDVTAPQFVYTEIEKRLKELESQHSDKDLRALKQILDCMQAKGLLDSDREEDPYQKSYQNQNQNQNQIGFDLSSRLAGIRRNQPENCRVPVVNKGNSGPREFKSPIVIMKPAKLMDKSSDSHLIPFDGLSGPRAGKLLGQIQSNNPIDTNRKASGINRIPKDPTSRNGQRELHGRVSDKHNNGRAEENSNSQKGVRSNQNPSRPQQSVKERTSSAKSSGGSLSPRLQQKKLESEKKTKSSATLPDSGKPRRTSGQVGSPGSRQRLVYDDQISDISSDTRNLSRQGDEVSLRSDSNISSASQVDIEVTSADRSGEVDSVNLRRRERDPVRGVTGNHIQSIKQKKAQINLRDGTAATPIPTKDIAKERSALVPEQPSPVSVLYASFYRDELSPSPVKKIPTSFKGDMIQNPTANLCTEDTWDPLALSNPGTKLASVKSLVHKLERLNSAHDEATTDHIASLCEHTNPDCRYVSEILLASGYLLEGLSNRPSLPHGSNPLSPDLFLVLEQTKPAAQRTKLEMAHRRLIFDMVNEILANMLTDLASGSWLEPRIQTVGPIGAQSPGFGAMEGTSRDKLVYLGLGSQIKPWTRWDGPKESPSMLLHTLDEIHGRPRISRTKPWVRANGLKGGHQLVLVVCEELERLARVASGYEDFDEFLDSMVREEISRRPPNSQSERDGVVLDLERMIFKELVDEMVSSEARSCRVGSIGARRRQLFSG